MENFVPFPNQQPTIFTRAGVESINPDQWGCYGIFRQGKWIYVGKGDIRTRLLSYLNGENPCITRSGPTHFVTVVTPNYDEMEKTLILELNPSCNQKVG
jgi:excinuclease UvrABC nuclease subunit